MTTTENLITAKELASLAEVDPKAIRRFIRSDASPVAACGAGSRYGFTADEARSILAAHKAHQMHTIRAGTNLRSLAELQAIVDNADDFTADEVIQNLEG